ncbi:hypothetical protein BJV82DRAFT_625180 [Fennellomyces sp. T-0311]|nr:hypothetical protein BJV82DRAFT_625180 [Fennellomyces sp. T-0311]
MASLARPRANSEMIPGSNSDSTRWIAEAFHRYTLPSNLNQEVCSDGGSWTHRIQSRFLGVSCLKVGSCSSQTTFYEISESEISEIAPSTKRSSESSDNDPECVDALLSLSTAEIFLGNKSPMALPPKKRKRRRVIRYDVIFCLDMAQKEPTQEREYYLFPRDAVVEAVNQASPFEVLVSYHLPKSSESSTLHSMCLCSCMCSYPSKLEEFAAVCSSSDHFQTSRRSAQRRLTDPGLLLWKPDCHVLNMQLSGVSRDLYIAMKQSVSGFETVCQRTMELMRLHTERLTCEKKEEPTMALTKTEIQSEEEDMYDKRPLPWSSDEDFEDEEEDDDQETDFCMTSPHSKSSSRDSPPTSLSSSTSTTKRNTGNSLKKCLYCGSKSTPMWRRGPQGAGTLCNACGVKWKHGKILCGNDATPSPAPTRRRSSSNKSTSSNERKRKANKKRTKAKEKKKIESEDDDLMSGIHYTATTTSRSIASSWDQHHQQPPSSLSSYSQSLDDTTFSPLESFSSSPNSSTSMHDSMMLDKLSAGVDAVEAATVLTLLKRS